MDLRLHQSNSSPMATCHVVAMPYPGRGHINPLMNLCNLLSSRRNNVIVTFVVTEEWLGFIGSEAKPDTIRYATIPNVLPSELVRAADMDSFIVAVATKMEEPFERILDRLDPPPNIIVADTFLSWAVDVGNRRNIPVASFWPMAASMFSIFHHFELLVQNKHFPVQSAEEKVNYIPGLSPFRLSDLPNILQKENPLLNTCLQQIPKVSEAQYLLFASIFELESPVIEALQSKFSFPLYSIGPLIPYLNIHHSSPQPTIRPVDDPHYLTWLDSQSQSSVLYVSLGSFLSVSNAQMDEIAAGLRSSGVKYLWVLRDKASRLKDTIRGGAGMIVPWCDQLKVLCHSSIGGFWTHCGWNSTMESVFAGVPFLAFPISMDQVPTSKLVTEDWKIGWKVKSRNDDLVKREEIADLVRRFMYLENVERKELVERARELRDMSRQAIEKGGSSEKNLEAFIKDISK